MPGPRPLHRAQHRAAMQLSTACGSQRQVTRPLSQGEPTDDRPYPVRDRLSTGPSALGRFGGVTVATPSGPERRTSSPGVDTCIRSSTRRARASPQRSPAQPSTKRTSAKRRFCSRQPRQTGSSLLLRPGPHLHRLRPKSAEPSPQSPGSPRRPSPAHTIRGGGMRKARHRTNDDSARPGTSSDQRASQAVAAQSRASRAHGVNGQDPGRDEPQQVAIVGRVRVVDQAT